MSKKLTIVLIITIFIAVGTLLLPKNTQALCDPPHKVGPKLGNRTDFLGPLAGGVYPEDFIRSKYDEHNGDCPGDPVALTVLYTFDGVSGGTSTDQGRKIRDMLNQMHSQNFLPILRLYTNYTGSGFGAISEADARKAAEGLNQIVAASSWNTNEIIVYPGNEINSPDEWPLPDKDIDRDAQIRRVKDYAKIYAAFSEGASGYRVFLPPLNAYFGVCEINEGPYAELFTEMVLAVEQNPNAKIDGAAFTVYNDPVGTIASDISAMASVAAVNGVSNYIISEVGPKVSKDGGCPLLDQEEDVGEWKEKVSAVFKAEYKNKGSVFGSAEKATTSYFLNCDGQLTSFLVVIGDKGDVTIEEEDKISCDFVPEKGGRRPLDLGWEWGQHMCRPNSPKDIEEPEFHPLRPYPINACDPLIPQSIPQATNQVRNKYNTYACGTSINFEHEVAFDPYFVGESTGNQAAGTDYVDMYCDIDPKDYECHTAPCPPVTCYKTIRYEIETDFRDSNIGILGNTQMELTDAQKVNNYLSWYLAGTPQVGDHEPLDKRSQADMDRLVNYSGPLRKLLPFDAQNAIRSQIAMAYLTGGPDNRYADLHDYEVGCKDVLTPWEAITAIAKFIVDAFENEWEAAQFILWLVQGNIDNAVDTGKMLVKLATVHPDYLEPENRDLLIEFLVAEARADLLDNHDGFFDKLASLTRSHIKMVGDLLSALDSDYAVSCEVDKNTLIRLSGFEHKKYPSGKLPPDPLDYDNFRKFWMHYNNWRGLTNVPLIGPQDWINPAVNGNIWSQLFPNIPLGGLEDIAGEVHPSLGDYETGPAAGPEGITAPPQLNIIEAERARATQP